jgi:F-type H+-transporting ATPase subunit epsilon
MFDKPFTIELVTPERIVFRGDVMVVSAPGVEGGFQVLKNHAALLTSLEIGRIRLRGTPEGDTIFATSGGFVEVRDNVVTILAETAERAADIDVARAELSRERAHERLRQPVPGTDIDRARVSLDRAINRISVAQLR